MKVVNLRKQLSFLQKGFEVTVDEGRKEVDQDKTRKVGRFQTYGLDRKKSDTTNYDLFFKVTNESKMEKNIINLFLANNQINLLLDNKRLTNGIAGLVRRSYLLSQKTDKKKDKKAPKGVWSGQLYKSFRVSL